MGTARSVQIADGYGWCQVGYHDWFRLFLFLLYNYNYSYNYNYKYCCCYLWADTAGSD